jgi:hypothetical protein
MNSASSNLLTSCRMVLRLAGVYLLSFYLIGLYAESMPNLCSITSIGISNISNIYHVKISRFSVRKVTSVSSYLTSRFGLTWSFLSGSLGLAGTSLSMASFFLSSPEDRREAGLTLRQHVCLFLMKGVEGYRWLVAWAPETYSECSRRAS